MSHPVNDPRSITVTITESEWRSTYRPIANDLGDEAREEVPGDVRPGQVWSEVCRNTIRSIFSGALATEDLPCDEEVLGYYITEAAVHPEVIIEVEPDPWTVADVALVRAAHREWEQERGIGVSGRVAANDFATWFVENRPGHERLFYGVDAERLLHSNLPELDLWSLYIDYLGSEGVDGDPVPGIERGCGAAGLEFNEFDEVRITKREWMWRFLPKVHRRDAFMDSLEWSVDDSDDDAFVQRQDPGCVWTYHCCCGESIIYSGYLPGLLHADFYYITEVPCPEGLNIQVEEATLGSDGEAEGQSLRCSSSAAPHPASGPSHRPPPGRLP